MFIGHVTRFLLVASLSLVAIAQTTPIKNTSFPPEDLTPNQKALVDGSKNAIVRTGISDAFFSKHFRLVSVVDRESDRRVIWEFEINEYKTRVVDSIGYHTQGTQRIPVHSVASERGKTSDIQRTLKRSVALTRLRSCIGNFEEPAVQYVAADGTAELVLTAAATRDDRQSANERKREREREDAKAERERKKARTATGDVIESEEEERERQPVVIGSVNLVTGKCTKGFGQII